MPNFGSVLLEGILGGVTQNLKQRNIMRALGRTNDMANANALKRDQMLFEQRQNQAESALLKSLARKKKIDDADLAAKRKRMMALHPEYGNNEEAINNLLNGLPNVSPEVASLTADGQYEEAANFAMRTGRPDDIKHVKDAVDLHEKIINPRGSGGEKTWYDSARGAVVRATKGSAGTVTATSPAGLPEKKYATKGSGSGKGKEKGVSDPTGLRMKHLKTEFDMIQKNAKVNPDTLNKEFTTADLNRMSAILSEIESLNSDRDGVPSKKKFSINDLGPAPKAKAPRAMPSGINRALQVLPSPAPSKKKFSINGHASGRAKK